MNPRYVSVLPLAALLVMPVSAARSDTYLLDKDHTEVRVSWDHLGVSRQSARFRKVSGAVEFDPAEMEATYVDVTVALGSLTTGAAALDEALTRTQDFFDLAAYPEAKFRSTAVRRTGARTAVMTGDLTINGITHPVTLDVTWNYTGEHPLAQINPVYAGVYVSGFSATGELRRSDWGITRTIPYVSDEVRITIETEMHRQAAPGVSAADGGAALP